MRVRDVAGGGMRMRMRLRVCVVLRLRVGWNRDADRVVRIVVIGRGGCEAEGWRGDRPDSTGQAVLGVGRTDGSGTRAGGEYAMVHFCTLVRGVGVGVRR